MRLPIHSMQAIRIRPAKGDADEAWYRSVVIDFSPDEELVVLLPDEKDLAKNEGGEEEETENGQAEDAEDSAASGEDSPGGSQAAGDEDDFIPDPIFERGDQIEVEISFPDGIRRFNSVVRRLELFHGGTMRIEWPTAGERIQRRDFVRVDVTYPAHAWFKDDPDGPLRQLTGTTINVSAGGVRLNLPEPLDSEQRVEIEVQGSGLQGTHIQGSVVRSGELDRKKDQPQRYWVAVEYVGVDESLRNALTQIVFDIQREQMKRSLS